MRAVRNFMDTLILPLAYRPGLAGSWHGRLPMVEVRVLQMLSRYRLIGLSCGSEVKRTNRNDGLRNRTRSTYKYTKCVRYLRILKRRSLQTRRHYRLSMRSGFNRRQLKRETRLFGSSNWVGGSPWLLSMSPLIINFGDYSFLQATSGNY